MSGKMGCLLTVGVLQFPQRLDKTPTAAGCRVVVAGVNVDTAALNSAMLEPSWAEGGAEDCENAGACRGSLGEFDFAAEPNIVRFLLLELQVNAWSLCNAV